MRARLIAAVFAATFLAQLGSAAQAGPSMCTIMEKLGYEWVRECEDPAS